MTTKVFIDGAAGTTGLEIRQRLAGRGAFSIAALGEADRKDPAARARALNDADIVILCLPDDAAREAVSLIENPNVRVIDASTAHRTADGWVYGFPELEPDRAEVISNAKRVSNPGCYATGFLALMRPLTRAGLIPADYPVTVNAISGYSGGGKKMIEEFERAENPTQTVFRGYGYTLAHKHVPEMQMHAQLKHPPVMAPAVGRFHRGMMVEIPLALWALNGAPTPDDIYKVMAEAYVGQKMVSVATPDEVAGISTLDAEILKNTDRLKVFVFGNAKTGLARVVAVLDNLGKGACGAALQNLNIMARRPADEGLL